TPAACDACARLVHQGPHTAHGRMETAENGFADEEVADIELQYLRDACHRCNRIVGQPVTRMDFETGISRNTRRPAEPLHLSRQSLRILLERPFAIGTR